MERLFERDSLLFFLLSFSPSPLSLSFHSLLLSPSRFTCSYALRLTRETTGEPFGLSLRLSHSLSERCFPFFTSLSLPLSSARHSAPLFVCHLAGHAPGDAAADIAAVLIGVDRPRGTHRPERGGGKRGRREGGRERKREKVKERKMEREGLWFRQGVYGGTKRKSV